MHIFLQEKKYSNIKSKNGIKYKFIHIIETDTAEKESYA